MSRKIVFHHRTGWSDHDVHREEFEFSEDASDKEIDEAFIDWVFEQVGDNFTWYDKEEE